MSVINRKGWVLNDPNISSRQYRAQLPVSYFEGSRKSSTKLIVINNIETGTFDVYEQGGFGGVLGYGSPIASYSPERNVLVPKNSTFNRYFPNTPEGKQQLKIITESAKFGTFDLANINATLDPIDKENFEKIKSTNGYKSLANQTPVGGRTPGATEDPQGGNPNLDSQSSPVPTSASPDSWKALSKGILGNPRKKDYENLRYPLKMQNMDVVKFVAKEYNGRGFSEDVLSFGDRNYTTISGSVTLGIQPSISDTNTVNWSGLEMSLLELGLSETGLSFIERGGSGLEDSVNKIINTLNLEPGVKNALLVAITQEAAGTKGLLSRLTGAVSNPNLELLFQGPQLRTFNFNFSMSPREKLEAESVIKIINYFKRNMAVSRSSANLFLKAPNVFDIQYLYAEGNDHRGLNKIKTCALLNCSVDYTPTGSYMTFNDSETQSMVSYNLSLTFQELEPVYEDEYRNHPIGY